MDDNTLLSFFRAIDGLSKGDHTALKRSAGRDFTEARADALAAFFRVLPREETRFKEEIWFMVATLYAGSKTRMSPAEQQLAWHETDFGWTLRRTAANQGSTSLENRIKALLDCRRYDQYFAYKLRQLVSLAESRQVPVNWPKLLEDLLYWDHPDRFVQKNWAWNYFKESKEDDQNAD